MNLQDGNEGKCHSSFFRYYINMYVFFIVTLQHLRPRTTANRERATALQHLHHPPRVCRGLDTSSIRQQRGRDLCCVQLQHRTIAIHTCNYGNTVFTYRPFDLLSHAVYSSCGQLWSLKETLSIWTVIEQQSWFFFFFFGPDSFVQMSLPCRGASSSHSWTL